MTVRCHTRQTKLVPKYYCTASRGSGERGIGYTEHGQRVQQELSVASLGLERSHRPAGGVNGDNAVVQQSDEQQLPALLQPDSQSSVSAERSLDVGDARNCRDATKHTMQLDVGAMTAAPSGRI